MVYCVLILLALLGGCFVGLVCSKYKIDEQKDEYKKLKNEYTGLQKEFNALYDIVTIKEGNKKEADEKINDLYNGDPVDNAIAGLSKR